MRAEILAVGSELLTPLRSDTNALWLTERLLEIGIEVAARTTVADDAALLASAFRAALARADVVLATGGLGPTEDDLTREAAAEALDRGLRRQPELLAQLEARFARYGRIMSPVNAKQADLIDGARALPNARGTAPGQLVEDGGRLLALLPGPPGEMQPMFLEQVLPVLRQRSGGRLLRTRVLKIASMAESEVDARLAPLYKTFANPRTTILSGAGQIELHLVAEGRSEAELEERLEGLASGMRALLPGRVFSEDGRELPEVVLGLLHERGLRLALAESCTGGLVAARLTAVPGASQVLERAFVTYSNAAKSELLGVPPELIEEHGAVSEPVAQAMARGARERAGVPVGAAITGIAGPDGGTPEKPVGTVFLALEGQLGARLRQAHFPGDRERVRQHASQALLEMLRRAALRLED